MSPESVEDPIKYTKESLVGLRDVWFGVAKAQITKAAAAFEQMKEKLPPSLKRKPTPPPSASETTTPANAPS
jgi:hypothetical protein